MYQITINEYFKIFLVFIKFTLQPIFVNKQEKLKLEIFPNFILFLKIFINNILSLKRICEFHIIMFSMKIFSITLKYLVIS